MPRLEGLLTMAIQFQAEKVKISQTKDNGFTIRFECGEYVREQVSKLVLIEPESEITVTVEVK